MYNTDAISEYQEPMVKFDLALFLQERAGSLSWALQYRQDLFKASTIASMVARFEVLLSCTNEPDLLSITPLAPHTQREQEQQESKQRLPMPDGGWFDLPEVDFNQGS